MKPWVTPFLLALASTGIVTRASRAAGISSSSAYALRRDDADFAAAWDQAMEDALDDLEGAARDRAMGYEELVVYQGALTPVWVRDAKGNTLMEVYEVIGTKGTPLKAERPVQATHADGSLRWLTVTKHSDPMAALLLKGRRKKVFADRTEVTGADGGPVQMDATARRARIASILSLAQSRADGMHPDIA